MAGEMGEQLSIPSAFAPYWSALNPGEQAAYEQALNVQTARALLGMGAVLGKMTDEATRPASQRCSIYCRYHRTVRQPNGY